MQQGKVQQVVPQPPVPPFTSLRMISTLQPLPPQHRLHQRLTAAVEGRGFICLPMHVISLPILPIHRHWTLWLWTGVVPVQLLVLMVVVKEVVRSVAAAAAAWMSGLLLMRRNGSFGGG